MAWFELLKGVESTIKETLLREGIQAIPEMFSGEGVTVELGEVMGKHFPELEVGDLGIIIGNREGHGFEMGEEVKVRRVDHGDDSYRVENDDNDVYWVYAPQDIEPKTHPKDVIPVGNFAIITFNILGHSFEIEVTITGINSLVKLSNEVTMAREAIKLFAELQKMDADRQNKFTAYIPMQIETWHNKIQLKWENGTKLIYDFSYTDTRFTLIGKEGHENTWGNTEGSNTRHLQRGNLMNSITSSIQKSWADILKIKEEEKEIGIRSQAFKEEQIDSLKQLNYYHWKEPETVKITTYSSGAKGAFIRYDGEHWFRVAYLNRVEIADEKLQIGLDNLKVLSDADISGSYFSGGNAITIQIDGRPVNIYLDDIRSLQVKNVAQSVVNLGRFLNTLSFTLKKWGDEINTKVKQISNIYLSDRRSLMKIIDESTGNALAVFTLNLHDGEMAVDRQGILEFNLIEGNFEELEEWKENFIKVNERAYGMAQGVINDNSDIITWTGDNVFELGPTPLGRIYVVDMNKFETESMCVYPKDHGGHYCINIPGNSKLPFGDHLVALLLMLITDDNARSRNEIKPQGAAPRGGWITAPDIENVIEEIVEVRKEYFDVADARFAVGRYSESDVAAWLENFEIMLKGIDTWALADYEKELVAEKRHLEEIHELVERLEDLEGAEEKSHDDILRIRGLMDVIWNHNSERGLASENKVST